MKQVKKIAIARAVFFVSEEYQCNIDAHIRFVGSYANSNIFLKKDGQASCMATTPNLVGGNNIDLLRCANISTCYKDNLIRYDLSILSKVTVNQIDQVYHIMGSRF